MENNFVGLHVHSQVSFLDGYSSIAGIAERAKQLGQKAVAITDHQEVGGHFQFQKECLKNGVKPLFGCEGYLVDSVTRVREEKDRTNSHITLIAKNQQGLENLWAWTTEAYNDNFYYRALQDWEGARKYSKGLFASDGCLLSYMADSIIKGEEDRQHQLMGQYLDVFGDNFYMELHTFQFIEAITEREKELNAQMTMVNQRKVELAQMYGVPLVVVNDAHYTQAEDWVNHALLWGFNTKQNLDALEGNQTATWMMDNDSIVHFMSKHGISEDITREAIKNTSWIANQCDVEIKTGFHMPSLTDNEQDELKTFMRLIEEGFQRKVVERGLDQDKYFSRMKNEVDTIVNKRFHSYFNVVADYSRWAKEDAKMLMGPARGSAGGSLVAYLMDITEVDPLKYDLMFSRFISEDRKGFPDIDLDFPQSRRGDVIKYLGARYGEDHICAIGTMALGKPKLLLKDLSRAMGIPHEEANQMTKVLDKVKDIDTARVEVTWEQILDEAGDELKAWDAKYPELFKKMQEMAGVIRQTGTHASGILVSNKPLLGNLPTRKGNKGPASSFTKDEVEELGFVKLDILGIRHLDTLQVAHDLILERHGVDIDFLSFGDEQFSEPEIWKCFETADVNGIFQAEANAMRNVGKRLKPKSVEDLAILYSVNRPGVVRAGLLDTFLRRWEGSEPVHSDHPMMDSIVGNTMGIVVYQEQVMQAVVKICGFTPSEADNVRKIISKQKMDQMKELKKEFIERGLQNQEFVETSETGNPKGDLERIWSGIETTAIYAFNKSHAVAYALLSAWEVWAKYHYLPEFLTALMITDNEKFKVYVQEARRKGFKILPPDINVSKQRFTIDGDNIHYGLSAIKSVGDKATDAIVELQPYTSIENFIEKTKGRRINKTVVNNLIKIGAFDSLHEDRGEVLKWYSDFRNEKEFEPIDFSDDDVLYSIELDLVGDFISHDPMEKYAKAIESMCVMSNEEMESYLPNESLNIGGQITACRTHICKSGEEMAFVEVTYNSEPFSINFFPRNWSQSKPLVEIGKPVVVVCKKLENGVCSSHVERLDMIDLKG